MQGVIELDIDLEEDMDLGRAVNLKQACKLLRGKAGGHVAYEVAKRWHKFGCRPLGQAGPRLYLPAVRVGGELLVMPEWIEAFERKRVQLGVRKPSPPPVTARQRDARHRAATERLRAAGVKV